MIELKNGIATGIRIHGPGRRPRERCMTVIMAKKGMITCGAFDVKGWVEQDWGGEGGYTAAQVPGSGQSFETALGNKVTVVTRKARKLGVKEGITGREALELMM